MNAEEAEALRLASDQYGVVTRQQAFDRGMTEDQVDHRLATGRLHLDGIRRAPLHVTAMRTVRRGVNVDVHFNVHSTRRLDRIDRVVVDGIPCTTATRTLIDIAPLVDDEKLESPLEVKMWRLIRESDLPLPERQVRIPPYRVDALWRTSWLILECDGFEAHAGYLRWKRDRRRVAFLEALGDRVVHVTWDHVTERPDEVLERVRLALARAA